MSKALEKHREQKTEEEILEEIEQLPKPEPTENERLTALENAMLEMLFKG